MGNTEVSVEEAAKWMREVFTEEAVLRLARDSGWLQRQREITPLALVAALVSTLGASCAQWLADVLRSFNALTGKTVEYKPFHNRLAHPQFPEFMRRCAERALAKLTMPVIQGIAQGKLRQFKDIRCHDGTSFALKDTLCEVWPGRFSKVSPAAVELHVTFSVFQDNPVCITLAADKESEHQFAPQPDELTGCLLLEDRGYEDQRFFRRVQEADGYYIVRGKKSIHPTIMAAWDSQGNPLPRLVGKKLSWGMLPSENVDLDIAWKDGSEVYHGRLVAIYALGRRNQKTYVYLHTNLTREEFSLSEVGILYRLRWQVELLFKQWKSYANLHRFDTSKAPIAQGLIWASILAATLKRTLTHAAEQVLKVELSTQRAASAAKHYLDDLLKCLLGDGNTLKPRLQRIFHYFSHNLRRAHPKRDRKKGRFAAGLQPIATS